jgi:hypothetical protein
VEDSNFTATAESTTSSEQCQIEVGFFFFTIQENVHNEFVPPGQTVTGCKILLRHSEAIEENHPDNGAMFCGPRIMTMLWFKCHSL